MRSTPDATAAPACRAQWRAHAGTSTRIDLLTFNSCSLTVPRVAPGRYKVKAWSEHSAQAAESEVIIRPGINTVTFDVKGDAEKGPGEDKFGMTRSAAR